MKYEIINFMKALMDFEAYVVESDFIKMFGHERGLSLWSDFKSKCARSVTIFYRILDEKDRKKFHIFLEDSPWLS